MIEFEVYHPEINTIYDCVHNGLLPKQFKGIWINEANNCVLFKCNVCKQCEIDLSKLPLQGSVQPIISARLLRKEVSLSMIPLSLICSSCKSIYYILNGIIEPNNGRTVVVFDEIIRLEKNHVIERKGRVLNRKIEGHPDLWKPYIPRFYRRNRYRLGELELTFYMEKLSGKDGSKPAAQVSIFSEENQSVAATKFLQTINESVQQQIDESFSRRERITDNIILIISGIRFTSTTSARLNISEISASYEAAITDFSSQFIKEIFATGTKELKQRLYQIIGLDSVDLLEKNK